MQLPFIQQKPSVMINQPSDFTPLRMLEIEIGQALPDLVAFDGKTGRHYRRANCLVRLHSTPLGKVELQFDESGMSAGQLACHIWNELHVQINEHLHQDGLAPIDRLDVTGLLSPNIPRCVATREQFLAHAPFVSVIVSTRDQPDRIPVCLLSILSLHYPHYEIIIVDNAPSTNATADFIQQTYGDNPQILYLREDRPGLSRARNSGIAIARGEILAFTDDDTVVDPNWLVEIVRAFDLYDNVACVTSLILPLVLETSAQFWFEEYGGFNKGFTRHTFTTQESQSTTPLYPYTAGRFGTGASMAFTAAFLQNVGGFDPALGAGSLTRSGEDFAIFLQVIMQGYKLVYEPASLLYHDHRQDYASLRKQIYNYGVGVTAYLIKSIFDNPQLLFDLLTKIPYGLFFILSARSPKNNKKSKYYPKELTTIELKGMLYGPLAYIRSRREMYNIDNPFVPIEKNTALPIEMEI